MIFSAKHFVLIGAGGLLFGCVSPGSQTPNGSQQSTVPGAAMPEIVGSPPEVTGPQLTDPDKALAALNEQTLEAALYCRRGKTKYPDASAGDGKKIRDLCDGIYVAGNGLIATTADYVQSNRWDSVPINKGAAKLDGYIADLRETVHGSTQANDWSKVGAILVDIGFRIWDGWKARKDTERSSFAGLIRAKKFPSYDEIQVSSGAETPSVKTP